ncbi:MAG: GTPase Era [Gammaproteobacteria bacterium RBG_16_57_12]|nr:MAG: GTPase Era [Gammaproteobacteria bacterium RBG_16_57_12]
MSEDQETQLRCGYVAIVGRPNVGKSTLLNKLLGQKISITSSKPQTTRHRILGIKTVADAQIVYVDTPGLHKGGQRAINRYMNRMAGSSISDVDAVILVVDRLRWTDEDQMVLDKIKQAGAPVILAINKIDQLDDKEALLPHIQAMMQQMSFAAVVPLSALQGDNIAVLEQEAVKLLPFSAPFFPEDQITDRSERFLAAEIIREKLMRNLGDEVPYALTVEIEKFTLEGGVLHIYGLIWVERPGQKRIIIGTAGEQLKRVGAQARQDMERLFDTKVFLKLWVKVKEGWSDDERAMRSLGYDDGH